MLSPQLSRSTGTRCSRPATTVDTPSWIHGGLPTRSRPHAAAARCPLPHQYHPPVLGGEGARFGCPKPMLTHGATQSHRARSWATLGGLSPSRCLESSLLSAHSHITNASTGMVELSHSCPWHRLQEEPCGGFRFTSTANLEQLGCMSYSAARPPHLDQSLFFDPATTSTLRCLRSSLCNWMVRTGRTPWVLLVIAERAMTSPALSSHHPQLATVCSRSAAAAFAGQRAHSPGWDGCFQFPCTAPCLDDFCVRCSNSVSDWQTRGCHEG